MPDGFHAIRRAYRRDCIRHKQRLRFELPLMKDPNNSWRCPGHKRLIVPLVAT